MKKKSIIVYSLFALIVVSCVWFCHILDQKNADAEQLKQRRSRFLELLETEKQELMMMKMILGTELLYGVISPEDFEEARLKVISALVYFFQNGADESLFESIHQSNIDRINGEYNRTISEGIFSGRINGVDRNFVTGVYADMNDLDDLSSFESVMETFGASNSSLEDVANRLQIKAFVNFYVAKWVIDNIRTRREGMAPELEYLEPD